jgi:hypothetical protein
MRTGLLALVVLFALYGSVVVGEIVALTSWAAYLRDSIGLSRTALRIVLLSATALPIAGLVGFALSLWAPVNGARAAVAAAVVYLLIIATLQLTIYDATVAVPSLLKVVFTLGPLWTGTVIARRIRRSEAA